jgi:signal transduction histidine kinase
VRLDWAALCRNTIERFEPRFRRAGLSLSWNQSAHEAWVDADGHRMEQVLENLLVNALRYVPEGGAVQVELTPESGERFGLTVRDNGPGIPAEELPLVFKRFYRGAGSSGGTAPDHGGSGLGLAIVREIVERHGGTVCARANTPRGLAITVELPRQRPETKERAS